MVQCFSGADLTCCEGGLRRCVANSLWCKSSAPKALRLLQSEGQWPWDRSLAEIPSSEGWLPEGVFVLYQTTPGLDGPLPSRKASRLTLFKLCGSMVPLAHSSADYFETNGLPATL